MKPEKEIKEMIDILAVNLSEVPSFSTSSKEKIEEKIKILRWVLSERKDAEVRDGNLVIPRGRLNLDWYPDERGQYLRFRINLKGLGVTQYVKNEAKDESLAVEEISVRLGDILELHEDYEKKLAIDNKMSEEDVGLEDDDLPL